MKIKTYLAYSSIKQSIKLVEEMKRIKNILGTLQHKAGNKTNVGMETVHQFVI